MKKLQPQAVLFDLGSTLIEYEFLPWEEMLPICAKNGRKVIQAEGLEVPSEENFISLFLEIRGVYREKAVSDLSEYNILEPIAALLERLGIDVTSELVNRYFEGFYAPIKEKLYAYSDTVETIKHLSQHGYKIGLVSNTIFPESTHREEMDRFGLTKYFDFMIFSSTFGKRKPHQDIFQHAAKLAGVEPSQAVYVGDRYIEDVTGPKAINMEAILKPKQNREYPEEMPLATRRIDHLHQLSDHIEY